MNSLIEGYEGSDEAARAALIALFGEIKLDESATFQSGLCQKCGYTLSAFGDCFNCGTLYFEQEKIALSLKVNTRIRELGWQYEVRQVSNAWVVCTFDDKNRPCGIHRRFSYQLDALLVADEMNSHSEVEITPNLNSLIDGLD